MSDYRRLISYIYEYEGKEKGKNIGFVKLEARNGQCRLNVNVKKVYVEGNATGVYLLGKDDKETFLGNIFIRNGSGEFRAVVDARNVEGTGNDLDTYYGLTVHSVKKPWRFYTTIWEDSVTHMAQDALPGSKDKALPQETVVSNVVKEIESEIAREEQRKADEEQLKASAAEVGLSALSEEESGESVSADLRAEETSNEQTSREQTSREQTSREQTAEEQAAEFYNEYQEADAQEGGMVRQEAARVLPEQEPAEILNFPRRGQGQLREKAGTQSGPKPGVFPPLFLSRGVNSDPDSDSVSAFAPVLTEPAPENRESAQAEENLQENYMTSPELENEEVLKYLQETEALVQNPELLWQELRKSYPKIQPFDYDEGCEILTINPSDIGRLPRDIWVYGNNSFLLHGYYNFRYLILVRLGNSKGNPRYLLGVPGHYYSNEKYMASMFGFPNFVLSKKQPSNDGRFGYWYTDIKLG